MDNNLNEYKEYLVKNIGCDDETIFYIYLNDLEFNIIMKFINKNNLKSNIFCQPYIEIESVISGENDMYE